MLSFAHPLRGKLISDADLSAYTSWRTGGRVDYLYVPADRADLISFIQQVPQHQSVTWLGLGSNTLIRDGGISGVVIITQGALNELSLLSPGIFRAEAGVACAQLARFSARNSYAGLEFMAGIPGTVGGALYMNAGCFGGETWTHITQVETIDRKGQLHYRQKSAFEIAYRHVKSPFATEWFVAAHFQLPLGHKETSLEKIRTLLDKRNATQPAGTANCGSVFRNPPGDFAGRLIEQCGLKGKTVGGAVVSEKHANFIINEHQASSSDIENLIGLVRATVKEKTSVGLIPEICILGRPKEG